MCKNQEVKVNRLLEIAEDVDPPLVLTLPPE